MLDIRIYWLWLAMTFNPANPRVWQLSEHFNDVESFVRNLKNGYVKDLNDNERQRIKKYQLGDAEKLLQSCIKKNINVYCYESEGYPEKLKMISNPPLVLFCYGNLDFLNDKVCISVVGTRTPSDYSVQTTYKICQSLIERNILLASGFATGIDQISNTVSLENNVPSVAFTGGAIDLDYPNGSEKFKMQIAEKGAVISEYCSSMKVPPSSFTQRNRMLVGLSDGVLFCECSAKSMGLDNAKHAEMQGKPVFVIPPHDIFDSRYFGQRNLIRSGCFSVFSGDDITYNLAYERFENMSISKKLGELIPYANDSEEVIITKPNKNKIKNKRKHVNNLNSESVINDTKSSVKEIDYSSLTELQSKICRSLENGNKLVDEIVLEIGEDISTVLSELVELELEGIVNAYPGKVYGLSN